MNWSARKGFKKHFGARFGSTTKGTEIEFGEYGLVALKSGKVEQKSFDSLLGVLKKHLKDRGRIFLRIVPDYSVTSKGIAKKMGGGAGKFDHMALFVKVGKVLVEIEGLTRLESFKVLTVAASKLPLKFAILERRT